MTEEKQAQDKADRSVVRGAALVAFWAIIFFLAVVFICGGLSMLLPTPPPPRKAK